MVINYIRLKMYKVEDYIKSFKENSIKITPQRLAIFKIIEGNTSHPSAEDIYIEVLKTHPTTSFATVYNTLDKLYKLNLLLMLTIDNDKKHYDPNTNQHHHLQCQKCKTIVDIFEDYEIKIPQEIRDKFNINGYQISFYGTCQNCI